MRPVQAEVPDDKDGEEGVTEDVVDGEDEEEETLGSNLDYEQLMSYFESLKESSA